MLLARSEPRAFAAEAEASGETRSSTRPVAIGDSSVFRVLTRSSGLYSRTRRRREQMRATF